MRKSSYVSILFFVGLALVINGCSKKKAASTADATKATTEEVATTAETEKSNVATTAAAVEEKKGPITMDGITVHQAVACRAVQDLSPVEAGNAFPADVGRIYLFSKVGLEGGGENSIKHVWKYKGEEVATVTLPVRGTAWRTYSSKAIQNSQKGDWKVDVSSGDGVVVETVSFTIE